MKGDKELNALIENAVMLIRGIIRTINYHIESSTQEPLSDESPILPLVEHVGSILSRCQKGRDGRPPFETLHGKKSSQQFVPLGEKVLAKQISTDPMYRKNTRYKFGTWLGMSNNSAECSVGHADAVFRAPENQKIGTAEQTGQRTCQERNWSSLENDRRQMDREQARNSNGPDPVPPLPFG